jgi:hypothetical protein
MWDVVRCLCNLSIFIPELRIQWSLSRKRILGTLNFCQSVPQPVPPTSSSPSEKVRVEALRGAFAKESATGAPVWEKMVEAPVLMGVAGAKVSPCADGMTANGAEPQLEDAPGWAGLPLGTSKGPGFSPSREVALDDVTSIPRPFDNVHPGTGVVGIPPGTTSACQQGASGRGCGVDMFVGRDCAPTTEGDGDHGWSGCSTTSPGQSQDGSKKLLYLIFPGPPSAT